LIGASSNLGYFIKLMPLPAVIIVLLLLTLMWVLIYGAAALADVSQDVADASSSGPAAHV